MPALSNPRDEKFCVEYARTGHATNSYLAAGYAPNGGARQSASRKLTKVDIKARVEELSAELRSGTLNMVLREREKRIDALEDRWQRMTRVIAERAADPEFAGVPGGATGLLVKTYKQIAKGKIVPEYSVDTGLLKEIRAHEEQAARELGEWMDRSEISGPDGGPLQVAAVDARARLLRLIEGRAEGAQISTSLGDTPALQCKAEPLPVVVDVESVSDTQSSD